MTQNKEKIKQGREDGMIVDDVFEEVQLKHTATRPYSQ
uniref:Uncharacterized protein n=1 Tax=Arundo donax TaxID=35708 RepID=A0A0A9D2W2_ARUDO